MSKRKKQSALRLAYQKERRRIQGWERRAKKRGFTFDTSVVPSIPKRITQKALEKIKQLRPKELYKKATYTDIETGEFYRGEEARKQQQKELKERRKIREDFYDYSDIEQGTNIQETPSLTAINQIEERIKELPDIRYGKGRAVIPTGEYRTVLLNALYDTMNSYDDISDYNNYLEQQLTQIQQDLFSVMVDSEQRNASESYISALSLISQREISKDEAIKMADASDFYGW